MKRPLLLRGLVILAVALIAAALAYPPKKKINLGLDLRGGMQLLLQVHTEDALRAETDSDMARLVDQAKTQNVTGLKARRTGDSVFAVSAPSPEARERPAQRLSRDVELGHERALPELLDQRVQSTPFLRRQGEVLC